MYIQIEYFKNLEDYIPNYKFFKNFWQWDKKEGKILISSQVLITSFTFNIHQLLFKHIHLKSINKNKVTKTVRVLIASKRIKVICGEARETRLHCILVKLLGLVLASQLVCNNCLDQSVDFLRLI